MPDATLPRGADDRPDPFTAAHAAARLDGTVMAQAVRCARDLAECAASYPAVFAAKPIDETMLTAMACANAFGSPELDAGGIRMAARASLWFTGLDFLVDHVATELAEIEEINRRCLDVADGAPPPPGDDLTRFLADIRDEAMKSPAFEALWGHWRAQFVRLLESGAREWTWKSGARAELPTFDAYLDNADNYGAAWVNISHWVVHADQGVIDHIDELQVVSRQVQRVLRLLNDLATYERDLTWGDLNAQMLGVDRDGIVARIDEIVAHCRELVLPLVDDCPDAVAYLARQIGFNTSFYGLTDYWGSL